jgi:hypothetical protein
MHRSSNATFSWRLLVVPAIALAATLGAAALKVLIIALRHMGVSRQTVANTIAVKVGGRSGSGP